MRRQQAWLCMLALLCAFGVARSAAATGPGPVLAVRIDGAIGPATADHIGRALERAARERAQLVVLQMDTPGGLDTAMRSIIRAILASPVPVAAFVAPQGAHAASAGTYIMYAAHVAAMAPATNLGAATPVAVGLPGLGGAEPPARAPASGASDPAADRDTLAAKRVNDASAYIRSLAQLRGRNAEWAEQAVRGSVSLSATDALALKVIDVVAGDLADLLRQLDGRMLHLGDAQGTSVTLATGAAAVVAIEPDWRGRLLGVISDPSLALILMLVGIYGLLFEFMNPGFVAPGVIGGVCLLLALWGLQMLPINFAGLALILLGIAFFVAEAFVPSFGALGLGGVAAFAFGALLLIDGDAPGFEIPMAVVGTLTLVSAGVVAGIVGMALRARRRPLVSGAPTMVGVPARILEADGDSAWASVDGERWQVRCAVPLQPGQQVLVTRVDGLTLEVSPLGDGGEAKGG